MSRRPIQRKAQASCWAAWMEINGSCSLCCRLKTPASRAPGANRYLLGPEQMRRAEDTAQRLGLELIGIFHSHPEHPAQPSEFDREWALPWFNYVITTIEKSKAAATRCWQLSKDRKQFNEVELVMGLEATELPD